MGKGLGIAAVILIILSFPLPVIGTWVGYLALIVAAFAVIFGDKALSIATTVLAALKMYALSPGLMVTMYAKVDGFPISPWFILTTCFVALPILAFMFRPAMRAVLQKIGVKTDSNSIAPPAH